MPGLTPEQLAASARRLLLPTQPEAWTVMQAAEISECAGCSARYIGRVRVVDSVPGCIVHAPYTAHTLLNG